MFRGAFAESEEQPHLAEAMDKVLRQFGGSARRWRIDHMSTAVDVKTGDLLPWFAALARHYGRRSTVESRLDHRIDGSVGLLPKGDRKGPEHLPVLNLLLSCPDQLSSLLGGEPGLRL